MATPAAPHGSGSTTAGSPATRNPSLTRIDALVVRHLLRAMLIVKLSLFIPVPGLIYIGSLRPPFAKYLRFAVAISAFQVIVYLIIGYLTGEAYHKLSRMISHDRRYVIAGFVVFLGLVYGAYRAAAGQVSKRL